ncbi:MAG: metal ABC transporter substrate-binding protein [Planctomycetota bacterium]
MSHARLFSFGCKCALAAGLLLSLTGCPTPDSGSNKPLNDGPSNRIVAVSVPLQAMAEACVDDSITVVCPAAKAPDPRTWRPDRESIAEMQSADMVIANGVGANYAKWLVTVSLPDSKLINVATKGMSIRDYIAVEDIQIVHSHGPEGEHSHPTMVAHTWLAPAIAKKQLLYIQTRIQKTYPDVNSPRFDDFAEQLDALIQRVEKSKLAESKTVLTATHEMKYLTRSLGLEDRHLNWNKDISIVDMEKQLVEVIAELKTKPEQFTNAILIPSTLRSAFGDQQNQLFEKLGLQRIDIDLIDSPQSSYLESMDANLQKMLPLFN